MHAYVAVLNYVFFGVELTLALTMMIAIVSECCGMVRVIENALLAPLSTSSLNFAKTRSLRSTKLIANRGLARESRLLPAAIYRSSPSVRKRISVSTLLP